MHYLVLVGDDLMLPFYRVPDDAYIANESAYALRSTVVAGNSTRAALELGYILTDDFYGDRTPLRWRGRELYVPDLAIGRLVETPSEMVEVIDTFLNANPLHATSAFVSGYDFLVDGAAAIGDLFAAGGLSVTPLIGEGWDAAALYSNWLETPRDVASVNAHFDHWQALPAAGAMALDASSVTAPTLDLDGTLHLSMGCHSGYNVHDGHASGGEPVDFAQALAGQGAWWIGNTGYGYGMDDSIAFSEQLMRFYAQRLTSESNVPVGEALRWAKARYLGGVPSDGFGTYDEKIMIETTLYGLPMYRVSLPGTWRALETPPLSITDLATETLSFAPAFSLEAGSTDGAYYSIGGEVQASPGRPVQPRTSALLPVKARKTPHGALLVGATTAVESLDPLIARPVTDTAAAEPSYEVGIWLPLKPWTINRLGDAPRLVVVPAQFRGNQDGGTLRRFTSLRFQVYYADQAKGDFTPPTVWKVESQSFGGGADFWVTAEDNSGIQRVVMVYTRDGNTWQLQDLTRNPLQDRWETRFTGLSGQFVYFVQVVDGAGNVGVTSNKGLFFEAPPRMIYLPVTLRGYASQLR